MRSYRQWLVFSKALLALLLLAGITPAPFAAVNVDRTRLVFAANDVVQSLTLTNDSVTPMLLQVWTDAGETASSPDSSRTPLVVLPPVFKMQPDELRTLRVMLSSRRSLPRDRESLFWLNIYQIPPEQNATDSVTRKLVLPLRLRLKVFIRPHGLKAPTSNDERKLRFSIASQGITITNPTPWYMSLAVAPIKGISIGNIMLAPYEQRDVALSNMPAVGSTVDYAVINDWGTGGPIPQPLWIKKFERHFLLPKVNQKPHSSATLLQMAVMGVIWRGLCNSRSAQSIYLYAGKCLKVNGSFCCDICILSLLLPLDLISVALTDVALVAHDLQIGNIEG